MILWLTQTEEIFTFVLQHKNMSETPMCIITVYANKRLKVNMQNITHLSRRCLQVMGFVPDAYFYISLQKYVITAPLYMKGQRFSSAAGC